MPDLFVYFNHYSWRHRKPHATHLLDPEAQNQVNTSAAIEMAVLNGEHRDPNASTASDSNVTHNNTANQIVQVTVRKEETFWKQWWRWILLRLLILRPHPVSDGRYNHISFESVNAYPAGYPRWAAYQNTHRNFGLYRRFGTMRNRLILHRQQEIAMLEEKLMKLDNEDHDKKNWKISSLKRDLGDENSERPKLMDEIEDKIKRYDELLEREQRSALMQRPSKREYFSLVNYLWNQKSIVRSEIQILNHRDDFVKLNECSESPLENFIDYIICTWIPFQWLRLQFSSESQMSKLSDRKTILTSPNKIFIISRLVAALLAIGLISIPLTILTSDVFTNHVKFITLMISLSAFPAAIQVAARPKAMELFVAIATYCAVLTTLLATSSTFSLSQLQAELSQLTGIRTV